MGLSLLLALAGSYLLGSIPSAYLLVMRLKRVDVRTVGSGNVGATNVARAAGWRAGLAVFLIDAAKGLVAVFVVAPWLLDSAGETERLACGLAAVSGHCFPVWLGFRGGKGVATMFGVLLGAVPLIGVISFALWVGSFFIWRYVSVSSLLAAAAIPLAQLAMRQERPSVFLGMALTLLIGLRHRPNIERLLSGTEPKAGRTSG